MNYTPKKIKRILKKCINELSRNPELFAKNPDKDFSRKRKLPFEQMVKIVLSMTGKSICGELMDSFGLNLNTPTASAFVQQRNKIKYEAFEMLFQNFTNVIDEQKLFKGYRLLAIDGSDLRVPINPNEPDSFHQRKNGDKPYNLLHINALYDLERRIYTDVTVEGKKRENEPKALVKMVDRDTSSVPTIYIADRGYEAYNNMAHIQEKGQKFIIRAKDFTYGGIVYSLNLPQNDEIDENVTLFLTRKQNTSSKQNLKVLLSKCVFDYLPTSCKKHITITPYELNFRVVRFKLTENTYEVLITNLDKEEFNVDELKKLYAMRWGIETSFRDLKYTIGLSYPHSKKTEYILQEVFAKLTMYNFAELITSHVVVKQKNRKYPYRINFAAAVHICRNFFLKNISPSDVEALLLMHLLPVRLGSANPRRGSPRTAPSFTYRIP